MQNERIFNDIPPLVVGITLFIAGVELVMQMAAQGAIGGPAAVGWRAATVDDFAVFPAIIQQMFTQGDFAPDYILRLFTYPYIHSGLSHALFAVVILLALGRFVGEIWHPVSLAIVFVAAGVVSGIVFGLIAPLNWPLYGAYPPVYGLIGAFSHLTWVRLKQRGAPRWPAFSLIIGLLVVQIIWGLLFKILSSFGLISGDPTVATIYVGIADLSGFFTGLVLSPILGPGGWQGFLSRIRTR